MHTSSAAYTLQHNIDLLTKPKAAAVHQRQQQKPTYHSVHNRLRKDERHHQLRPRQLFKERKDPVTDDHLRLQCDIGYGYIIRDRNERECTVSIVRFLSLNECDRIAQSRALTANGSETL